MNAKRKPLTEMWRTEVPTKRILKAFATYTQYPEKIRDAVFRMMYSRRHKYNGLEYNSTLPLFLVEELRKNTELEVEVLFRRVFSEEEIDTLLESKLSNSEVNVLLNFNSLTRSQVEKVLNLYGYKQNIAHAMLAQEHVEDIEREMLFGTLSQEQVWQHLALNPYLTADYAVKKVREELTRSVNLDHKNQNLVKTVFLRFPEIEELFFETWCKNTKDSKVRLMLSLLIEISPNMTAEKADLLGETLKQMPGSTHGQFDEALMTNCFLGDHKELVRKVQRNIDLAHASVDQWYSRVYLNSNISLVYQKDSVVKSGAVQRNLPYVAGALKREAETILDSWPYEKTLEEIPVNKKATATIVLMLLENRYFDIADIGLLVAHLVGSSIFEKRAELQKLVLKVMYDFFGENPHLREETEIVEKVVKVLAELEGSDQEQEQILRTFMVLLPDAKLTLEDILETSMQIA